MLKAWAEGTVTGSMVRRWRARRVTCSITADPSMLKSMDRSLSSRPVPGGVSNEPRGRRELLRAVPLNEIATGHDVGIGLDFRQRKHRRHARFAFPELLRSLAQCAARKHLRKSFFQLGPSCPVSLWRQLFGIQPQSLEQRRVKARLDRAHRHEASVGCCIRSIERRTVDAGAELTRCAGFDLTRVRPMNALVSR